MSSPRPILVALAGNPNAGKTTAFNSLTGARARTGNYPGITVERRVGELSLPSGAEVSLIDLPGTYSLTARSPEEEVAVDCVMPLAGEAPRVVVVVVEASALERHLYLASQILDTGLPVVVALNMIDEARAAGVTIDCSALGRALGAEVVPIAAKTGEGKQALLEAIDRALAAPTPERAPLSLAPAAEREVALVETALKAAAGDGRARFLRSRALWALLSLGDDELVGVAATLRQAVDAAHARAASEGRDLDAEIIGARYLAIEKMVAQCVQRSAQDKPSATERIDAVLTHPIQGLLVFAAVMALLFQALFSWSDPLIGLIENLVVAAQVGVRAVMPEGPLADLLVDGVVQGVGNVIVFVPQIALLSLFVVVLEDSGYLARVAFVIDRVMGAVGLHGRAFVPLLSGFACAVPAVVATRTIENRRDRLVTMLALPLMSCSARLPVYTLVIGVVFAGWVLPFGVAGGALVLFSMYALSVIAALGAAAVMRRTVLRGPRPVLVLELPPYRLPMARDVGLAVWSRLRAFLVDAGTIILAITVVLWALLSYPQNAEQEAEFAAQRVSAEARLSGEELDAQVAEIEAEAGEARMAHSFAGTIGRAIEPAIAPLGFDWKIGVGLVASFAAREVLVSTLGIVYGAGADTDEESAPLRERLQRARRSDGSLLFTPLVGVSLMVFFVLAAQCMSTLAVVKRESGSWRWPIFMVIYMNALAYGASLLVYQGGLLLGFS